MLDLHETLRTLSQCHHFGHKNCYAFPTGHTTSSRLYTRWFNLIPPSSTKMLAEAEWSNVMRVFPSTANSKSASALRTLTLEAMPVTIRIHPRRRKWKNWWNASFGPPAAPHPPGLEGRWVLPGSSTDVPPWTKMLLLSYSNRSLILW